MIQAELTDGRIVELEQDCACRTHTGPHWLHMDAYERYCNLELLAMAEKQRETARNPAAHAMIGVYLHKFAELETARLNHKKQTMERAGIVRLIEETP